MSAYLKMFQQKVLILRVAVRVVPLVLAMFHTIVGGQYLDTTITCKLTKPSVYECEGQFVPETIPSGIDHVILEGINLTRFRAGQFSDASWNATRHLQVYSNNGGILQGSAFIGLDNLEHLEFYGNHVYKFERGSFRRLPSVKKLDLSNNIYLNMDDVLSVLSEDEYLTLPSLEWLKLAKVGRFLRKAITMDAKMFDILSRRPITYLDISYFAIKLFDRRSMVSSKICTQLQQLIMRDTTLYHLEEHIDGHRPKGCKSLILFDIQNMRYDGVFNAMRYSAVLPSFLDKVFAELFVLLVNVETLLMGNSLYKDKLGPLDFSGHVFRLNSYLHRLQTIDVSRNSIRLFNATVELHSDTIKRLRHIDFSDNLLEYIEPQAIGISTHVETLDLGKNHLDRMRMNYNSQFERLLSNLTNLRSLTLSENKLSSIPLNMFLQNYRLQYMYISHNYLTCIHFKLGHLVDLEILDIRDNSFLLLDTATLEEFRKILNFQIQNDSLVITNERSPLPKLTIFLDNNPFVCDCTEESLNSLEWIGHSGTVVQLDSEIQTTCNLEEKQITIFKTAFSKTKSHCLRVAFIRYGLIGGAAVIVTAIVIACVIICRYRRRKKRNAIQALMDQLRTGDKLKNLIFLSFCNEDEDHVLEHIHPRMKQEASLALGCDRSLVSCGDMDFRPGMSVCMEVMRCIEEAAVIVFVLSNTFCQKSWCKMEVDTANALRKPVILLMLEKVDLEKMTPYIRNLFNRYTRAFWIQDEHGGYPRPPWPKLMESVITLASSFKAENDPPPGGDIEMAAFG